MVDRVLKKYRMITTMHPHTTLTRLLVHPVDKVEPEKQGELVYQMPYEGMRLVQHMSDRTTV